MAKKKGSSRRKMTEGEVDSLSVASGGGASVGSDASETDVFEEIIDELFETRAAAKLEALRRLVQLMGSYFLQQECAARETTLCRAFSQSIKRGRDEIPVLAARGFSLLVLTLGAGVDDSSLRVWETIQCNLIPKSLSGKSVAVRCASIEALALGCFVVEDDFFKIQETMESLSALWKHGNAMLVTAAVRGWTLILSSYQQNMIASSNFDNEVSMLRSLLESPDSGLQQAAGTAVALLYTLGVGMEDEEGSEEDGSDSVSDETSASHMDELRDRMRDLSEARGPRSKSKKLRASQKATFRNICSFIEDGIIRETKIKLQYGDVLTLTSLQKHIQMDFFRSILGSGFHRHLHENALMHLVFNFRPKNVMESTRMTKIEKRNQKSPSSWSTKLRKQTRDWERMEKQNYLHNGNLFGPY